MAQKYAAHVSTKALFGYDANSGDFQDRNSEISHKLALNNLRTELTAQMSSGGIRSETASAFAGMVSQAGTKGKAFEQVADSVGAMDRAAILNAMQAGTAEEQKKIQTSLMNIISRAQKDDAAGLKGTKFQSAREQMIKVDVSTDDARKISEKLRAKLVSGSA